MGTIDLSCEVWAAKYKQISFDNFRDNRKVI